MLWTSWAYGGRLKKAGDFADFDINLGAEWIHTWVGGRPEILEDIMNCARPDFATFPWTSDLSGRKGGSRHATTYCISIPCCCQNPNSRARRGLTSFDRLIQDKPRIKERIRFHSPVSEINHDGARVVVKTASGVVHEAGKVPVTVPITILQNGSIRLSPALPERQQREIRKEHMPEGFKVFIEFSERFWPDVILFEGIIKGALGHEWYFDATMGKRTERHVLRADCGWRKCAKEIRDLGIGRRHIAAHHRAVGSYVRGPRVSYIPKTHCAELEQQTIHSGHVLSPQGFGQETRSPAQWQSLFRRRSDETQRQHNCRARSGRILLPGVDADDP
jgi:hypothetical protein